MKRLPAHANHWVVGTLVAMAGVLIARWLAPQYADPVHAGVSATGQLIGVTGLLIVCLGVRRRLRNATDRNVDTRL